MAWERKWKLGTLLTTNTEDWCASLPAVGCHIFVVKCWLVSLFCERTSCWKSQSAGSLKCCLCTTFKLAALKRTQNFQHLCRAITCMYKCLSQRNCRFKNCHVLTDTSILMMRFTVQSLGSEFHILLNDCYHRTDKKARKLEVYLNSRFHLWKCFHFIVNVFGEGKK